MIIVIVWRKVNDCTVSMLIGRTYGSDIMICGINFLLKSLSLLT